MNLLLAHSYSAHNFEVASELSSAGHQVVSVHSIDTALELATFRKFDAVIIDQGISEGRGLELCRLIRKGPNPPTATVMLTSAPSLSATLESFGMGADDHLAHPFDTKELSARLKAIIRAYRRTDQKLVNVGDLALDLDSQVAYKAGSELRLSRVEFQLLRKLAEHAPGLVTFEQLFEAAWPSESPAPSALYVQVSNLRRRLAMHGGPHSILAIQNRGYRLVEGARRV